MRLITKIAGYWLVILLSLNVFAVHAAIPAHKKTDNVNYLFIDEADQGALEKSKDNDTYTLTLYKVDNWVTYFSDVPHRVTGIMQLEKLAKIINESVKTYPKGLNTGIIAVEKSSEKKVRYMLSLSALNYDANSETATFTGHLIPGEHKNKVPDNAEFKHISLFIDSVCLKCIPKP